MADTRQVAVVTGTRAEYGLLYWLLKAIAEDPELDLQLLVTGSHLEPRFGETVKVIEADGFSVAARVPLGLESDEPAQTAAAMGRGVVGFAAALDRLKPDLLVVLGDRWEILAAAQAAMMLRIPLAHIHGGEATEGAIDEAIRHAITKMAQLHFVAATPYYHRVVQMGEQPDRVFVTGATGLDNIARLPLLERPEFDERLGFDLGPAYFLATYHPVTLSDVDQGEAVAELRFALSHFPDHRVVLTGVNADPGHNAVAEAIAEWAAAEPGRVLSRASLGQLLYLSAMKHCAAVIGNSSSGLLEAPAFGVPTVNIGERQRGRLRADSVIDCGAGRDAIAAAVSRALSPEFVAIARNAENPFGTSGVAERIRDCLKTVRLDGILMKRFHDLPGLSG